MSSQVLKNIHQRQATFHFRLFLHFGQQMRQPFPFESAHSQISMYNVFGDWRDHQKATHNSLGTRKRKLCNEMRLNQGQSEVVQIELIFPIENTFLEPDQSEFDLGLRVYIALEFSFISEMMHFAPLFFISQQ
jgi:hypothetical protein